MMHIIFVGLDHYILAVVTGAGGLFIGYMVGRADRRGKAGVVLCPHCDGKGIRSDLPAC